MTIFDEKSHFTHALLSYVPNSETNTHKIYKNPNVSADGQVHLRSQIVS